VVVTGPHLIDPRRVLIQTRPGGGGERIPPGLYGLPERAYLEGGGYPPVVALMCPPQSAFDE
jgi:hypothetical protein